MFVSYTKYCISVIFFCSINYYHVYVLGNVLTPEEIIKEDALLDTVELLMKHGYPAEKHHVTTEDGYILELHRMLPKNYGSRNHPVFIMHGLLASSFEWIILGPGNSIVYLLHEQGFDVWLGNARGNLFSRNHISLNPNSSEFWKFSWHEIGYYDIPASIDYVLEKTNSTQLHYVGHSQGCTTFIVMCCLKPKYNDKIRIFNALSPPTFMSNSKIYFFKHVMVFHRQISSFFNERDMYEIPLGKGLLQLCVNENNSSMTFTCKKYYNLFLGSDKLLNTTLIPFLGFHSPAGSSLLQLIHYGQEFISGRFCQFDYGKTENKLKYGTAEPPDYPLENMVVPTAIHWGDGDLQVDPIDIKKFRYILQNVVLYRRVPYKNFNHMDFLLAINAKKVLYDTVIQLIIKFD